MSGENTTQPVRSSSFVARAEDAGKRLDVLLAERVPELSRRRARVLIAGGSVYVDGGRVLVHSRRIAAGAEVACHDNPFASTHREALDPALVLHEDAALIAVDKPAGIPAHPTLARRQGTALQLSEEWLRRRAGEKVPLLPVHRLDAGTSGILLFAKTARAARALSQNFARRRVRKTYVALVHGIPNPAEGEIRAPILESAYRSSVAAEGREAITRYRTVRTFEGTSLLEVEPLTGRMHQIRVHLASIGHPVIGDTRYGSPDSGRLHLHAARLELPHPDGGAPLVIESPPPAEWSARFAKDSA
jgi:23S rRNA pseudouridine1911/1915/1917 synthase